MDRDFFYVDFAGSEIGLTPQTVGLLDAAFGDRVALLHSALTPEERSEQVRRRQEG